ncbi:TIM-barrel domain-containing protein [Nonomuraea sp. NPDC049709]|uniref:TIM-barrel domain-containing protein n=1 Tax=Nonomuraea sp. NPDC049709 TaxID=3154736 RepID=UPI003414806C
MLEERRGRAEAVLFARSATAGSQRLPVHGGGDTGSTYESVAETPRMYPGPDGESTLTVTDHASGEPTRFTVVRSGGEASVSSALASGWSHELA